ncbi:MAG: hypothetical protein J6K89_01555 [Oscillospiraceae bacterium]|nr:hypothetical protein [Oscillospiraceae bacterium]
MKMRTMMLIMAAKCFCRFLAYVGSTMLCFWALVLLGCEPSFLIGFLSAVPGVLLAVALERYINDGLMKYREETIRRAQEWQESCRFKKDGACTFGEGRDKCVHDEERGDGDG